MKTLISINILSEKFGLKNLYARYIKEEYVLLMIFLLIFLESRRKRKRERNTEVREKHLSAASNLHFTGDRAYNQGTCPD